MTQTPGVPDHAAAPVQTVGWSPKALFATAAAIVVPVLLQAGAALIEALAGNPALFDGLPQPWPFLITTALTGVGVLYAAWRANPGAVVTTNTVRSDPPVDPLER